jgi:hypothetical protein
VTQYAAAKAGLTLAVIDSEISSANEVEFILHDSKANGIIFEPKIAGRDHTKVIQELFPELATCKLQDIICLEISRDAVIHYILYR